MLTTSKRIVLLFTGSIALAVLLFGVIINILFFGFWRQRETQFFHAPPSFGTERMMMKRFGNIERLRNSFVLSEFSEEMQDLYNHTLRKNVAHIDGERYLYKVKDKAVVVSSITHLIENQLTLIWITIGLIVFFTRIGYLVSHVFVRKSLRDLHTLSEKVDQIDIEGLSSHLKFPHLPEGDEIQRVAHAIEQMNTKLHQQITTIKQFVSNVSHEFKTPLMALQSTLEVTQKNKEYTSGVETSLSVVGMLNRLLETMLSLSSLDKQPLLFIPVDLVQIVTQITTIVPLKYNHHISIKQNMPSKIILTTHQGSLERILTNLLDNAYKFSPDDSMITIEADEDHLCIYDQGVGIAPEQIDQIWEPFRQADTARSDDSFGLGLSLVKQLVEILGWKIQVQSRVGEGARFTIFFHL